VKTLSLTQLVPVLQLAIGPVILISGVGLLLLTLTGRFGKMVDRSRELIHELSSPGLTPAVERNLRGQVAILQRRAWILRLSIALSAVTILMAGVLILALFLSALWQLEAAGLLVAVFCTAILCLIGSILAFLADMNLALRAVHLDWSLVGGEHEAGQPRR
jgi:Protein of unknown function (DUF2721)